MRRSLLRLYDNIVPCGYVGHIADVPYTADWNAGASVFVVGWQ